MVCDVLSRLVDTEETAYVPIVVVLVIQLITQRNYDKSFGFEPVNCVRTWN